MRMLELSASASVRATDTKKMVVNAIKAFNVEMFCNNFVRVVATFSRKPHAIASIRKATTRLTSEPHCA